MEKVFMECMTCVETVARLHLYLDRELSDEEIATVKQHLADCPHCECRFHVDMSIKRLIHERCRLQHAPAHLQETVWRIAHMSAYELQNLDPALTMEITADLEGW
jgi:mycothiol system anti-sigma-R factor